MSSATIKGTEWEEIVFPKPQSQEEKMISKMVDDYGKKIADQTDKYEHFFNTVLPNTDLNQ